MPRAGVFTLQPLHPNALACDIATQVTYWVPWCVCWKRDNRIWFVDVREADL